MAEEILSTHSMFKTSAKEAVAKVSSVKRRKKKKTPVEVKKDEFYKTLNKQQKKAFDLALNGEHLFITGGGGVGKSYLLKGIVETLRNFQNKQVMVCAPTGVAARNVDGVTIHKQFNFPVGVCLKSYKNGRMKPLERADRSLKTVDCVVLDEVSMLRLDIVDSIFCSIEKANKDRVSKHLKPIQVILMGDMFQLPPIFQDEERKFLEKYYSSKEHCVSGELGGGYFFNSIYWKELRAKIVILDEVVRQKDPELIYHLNKIREGKHGFTQYFNNHVCYEKYENAISLYPFIDKVKAENERKLAQIEGREYIFEAQLSGRATEEDCEDKYELHLKIGAKVMFLINDNPDSPNGLVKDRPEAYTRSLFVNGTIGIIRDIHQDDMSPEDEYITIEILDSEKIIKLKRHTYSIERYEEKDGKLIKKKIGSVTQFPIILGFALSIHKSQGLTLDRLNISPNGFDCPGLLYVALSRCTSIEGLHLEEFIKDEYVRADPEVKAFYDEIKNQSQ